MMSPTAVMTTVLSGSGGSGGTEGDEGFTGAVGDVAAVGSAEPAAGSKNPQEDRSSIGSSAHGIAFLTFLAILLTVLYNYPLNYIFTSAIKKYKKVKNGAPSSQIHGLVYNRGTERIGNTK
ncbi:hypothetical protein T472_0203430 [Youngiibacter fragilis 232.1]|uniref:Uncharacterized protein n=1 Tax=Youngiibacter fragilis 232.1 TaxID=994573 RepID=V7I733_9CLOT|nr:hypothetical protein T472_0203430 [Youngiibacter fragilis 232.1]